MLIPLFLPKSLQPRPQNTEGTLQPLNLCPQILSGEEGAREDGEGGVSSLAKPSHRYREFGHPLGPWAAFFLLATAKYSVFFLSLLPGSLQQGMREMAVAWQ